MKYVVRDFPLSMHPQAFKAAEAAACAGAQDKYWEMHEALFSNQRGLEPAQLVEYAKGLGLDAAAFQGCLESGRHSAKVRKDLAEGQRAGVTGTPAFFLGLTEPGSNTITVVKRISGAQPYAAFQAAIEELLTKQ